MSATESKGKGGTVGIILVLLVLVGVGVGAALLLGKKNKGDDPEAPVQEPKKEEVVAPSTRLVEAPPPLPEKAPVVEEPEQEEPAPAEEEPRDTNKSKRKPIPTGTIDVKAAQAVTKKKYTKVRACYEKQLKVNHLLQGNIKVRITVYPDGSVHSVKLVQDTMHNKAMNSCIKSEIKTWKFPKPQGGKVDINQSYRLEPKAG